MHKNIKLFTFLGLSVSCLGASLIAANELNKVKATSPLSEQKIQYVDFYNNYLREDFTLSNGTKGKGNNLLYKTVEVVAGNKVSKPTDPTRRNYDFVGWYKEEKCENAWNFDTDLVINNTRLFAKWEFAHEEDIVEPPYTPPSTVLDSSASTNYVIDSIMSSKIESNQVKLTTASIAKLNANKTNVLAYMEYRVKTGVTFAASYDNNKITVKVNGETAQDILVKDVTTDLTVDNSNYETKAKNYEKLATEEENYHVMLAGSSSIEFWESSKEDLAPIVSYNHGIGGTTIEQWTEKLNKRLVYPAKPKMVVYYVGINNVINSKEDASTIYNKLVTFFDTAHRDLPNTKIQYILMNLIPNYKGYFNVINSVNAQVIEYQKSHTWLTLINPGVALLKDNGEPNAAYFRTDGLHLSYYGYVVWGGIIKESIVNGLENN